MCKAHISASLYFMSAGIIALLPHREREKVADCLRSPMRLTAVELTYTFVGGAYLDGKEQVEYA